MFTGLLCYIKYYKQATIIRTTLAFKVPLVAQSCTADINVKLETPWDECARLLLEPALWETANIVCGPVFSRMDLRPLCGRHLHKLHL